MSREIEALEKRWHYCQDREQKEALFKAARWAWYLEFERQSQIFEALRETLITEHITRIIEKPATRRDAARAVADYYNDPNRAWLFETGLISKEEINEKFLAVWAQEATT